MIIVFWALPRLGVLRLSAAIFLQQRKNTVLYKRLRSILSEFCWTAILVRYVELAGGSK
jgi:hypothetical protein